MKPPRPEKNPAPRRRRGYKFHRLLRLARKDLRDEEREETRGHLVYRPHSAD